MLVQDNEAAKHQCKIDGSKGPLICDPLREFRNNQPQFTTLLSKEEDPVLEADGVSHSGSSASIDTPSHFHYCVLCQVQYENVRGASGVGIKALCGRGTVLQVFCPKHSKDGFAYLSVIIFCMKHPSLLPLHDPL